MKKVLFGAIILLISAIPAFGMVVSPGDSIGTKIVNGKAYVLYRITKGDNLGQISRAYGTSVANLEELNDIQGGNIQIGQVLMVPSRSAAKSMSLKDVAGNPSSNTSSAPTATKTVTTSPAPQNPVSSKSGGGKEHTVEKGETLYAISRKYGISVPEIKAWNNMTSDALSEGQKLIVSKSEGGSKAQANVDKPQISPEKQPEPVVDAAPEPKIVANDPPKIVVTPKETNPVAAPDKKIADQEPAQPKFKNNSGTHVVRAGETLFGIARTYGMDVSDLKKINRLENTNIAEGQALRVKADSPENQNQGISLADMLEAGSDTTNTPKLESFPDLTVLTAPKETTVSKSAKVESYVDKSSGKTFKRVEEAGKVGKIEDFSTDQTRFYAFHRNLPIGSYLRVDYPAKGQSILVEVIGQLPEKDANIVRLTAKCLDYLMIREKDVEVRLRYVIPFGQ